MGKEFTRKFKPLDILSEAEVDAIWEGILDVLENTGLKFDDQQNESLKIFDEAGCEVHYTSKTVKFPRDLIVKCLSMCPRSFRLEARNPKDSVIIGEDRVCIQPGPGMEYIDIDSFEPRKPSREELYDSVTVYDALPNVHYYHPLSPNTSFEGVAPAMAYLEVLASRIRNSTKPNSVGSPEPRAPEFIMEMARVIGTNMLWARGAAPPLTWSNEAIIGIMAAIRAGFPMSFTSGAIWGASAPVTIAGAMVSNCAEVIGPVVLSQLLHPGHPLTVKLFAMPQNMRSGAPFFGNIACALGNAAFHQIWRRYGIPTTTVESGIPNSKCMDFQSGYEKGMLALAAAISGAHAVWIHGTVYGELTAHPVQVIMDDDISGMIGRFLEGIEVNEECLAIDLIKEVGSGPDFYLNKEHTRKWWRKEQFMPAVADTTSLPEWIRGGKKSSIEWAKEKMKEILAKHRVSEALTASQERDIEYVLEEARKFYKKIGRI